MNNNIFFNKFIFNFLFTVLMQVENLILWLLLLYLLWFYANIIEEYQKHKQWATIWLYSSSFQLVFFKRILKTLYHYYFQLLIVIFVLLPFTFLVLCLIYQDFSSGLVLLQIQYLIFSSCVLIEKLKILLNFHFVFVIALVIFLLPIYYLEYFIIRVDIHHYLI